jgi:hypothetical protein
MIAAFMEYGFGYVNKPAGRERYLFANVFQLATKISI